LWIDLEFSVLGTTQVDRSPRLDRSRWDQPPAPILDQDEQEVTAGGIECLHQPAPALVSAVRGELNLEAPALPAATALHLNPP
jgi:hypothetical protein